MKTKIYLFLTIILSATSLVLAFLYFDLKNTNESDQKNLELIGRSIISHSKHLKEHRKYDSINISEKLPRTSWARTLYDANLETNKRSDSLISEIKKIKNEFLRLTRVKKYGADVLMPVEENNTELTNQFFIESKNADKLKALLVAYIHDLNTIEKKTWDMEKYKKWWLGKDKTSIFTMAALEDSINNWSNNYFKDISPLSAYAVLLTIEYDVYQICHLLNFARYQFNFSFTNYYYFNILVPLVRQEKNFIKKGQPFKAEIFLGTYDTRTAPNIIVEGKEIPVRSGRAIYSFIPEKLGLDSITGLIKLRHFDGGMNTLTLPFKSEYYVIP